MTSCSYQNCSTVRKPCSDIVLFNLPTDAARRTQWIINSGNPDLLQISATSKRFFCEKHFDPKFFRRQFNRTTLHPSAVPKKFDCEENIISEDENLSQSGSQITEIVEMNVEADEEKLVNDEKEEKLKKVSPVILNKSYKRSLPLNNESPKPKRVVLEPKLINGVYTFFPISNTKSPEKVVLSENQPVEILNVPEITNQVETNDESTQITPEVTSIETQTDPLIETTQTSTVKVPPKIEDEDSYFCVKVIAEAMKRLTPEQKAKAKLHMITYLFELEHT